MTKVTLITELTRMHSELQSLLNPSILSGLISDEEKLWFQSSLYHLQSIISSLRKRKENNVYK